MNNLIELKNVSKNYISSKKIEVLKNINYTFKSGKTYSLIGPSGSGKSTLLNLISLIDKPTSGFIKLDNVKINDNDIDLRHGTKVHSRLPHVSHGSARPKTAARACAGPPGFHGPADARG